LIDSGLKFDQAIVAAEKQRTISARKSKPQRGRRT
jgi:hypothetical protein